MKRILSFKLLALLIAATSFGSCSRNNFVAQTNTQHEVKNIIYMIGDGMGIAHVSALMASEGFAPVNLERATSVGLVKTYSADNYVTDSAAGGTALATGNKTSNRTIGMTPDGRHLSTLVEAARSSGRATGLVVTSYITDATPAAFYGKVSDRKQRDSLAVQFLNSGIDLAFGGGQNYFDPNMREDGRDVMSELEGAGYRVVRDTASMNSLSSLPAVALIVGTYMQYSQDGRGDYLPLATAKAIDLLSATPGGFFLMVEGSLIDYAAHDNDGKRVVTEMRDFDYAVGLAFDYADAHPGTLVVVTADHETGGLTLPTSEGTGVYVEEVDGKKGIVHSFSSDDHTASMVPLFAYGTGAEAFKGVLENTEVARILFSLMVQPLRGTIE